MTPVDISNLALSYVGDRATLASLDEDSYQAEVCKRSFPLARDMMLASHDWPFNVRRASLAQMADPPPFGWSYAFAFPEDCLHLTGLYAPGVRHDQLRAHDAQYPPAGGPLALPTASAVEYAIGEVVQAGFGLQRAVFANIASPVARYRARVEDTALFTPEAAEALSWLLASFIAGPLVRGAEGLKLGLECRQRYEALVRAAAARSANEVNATPVQVSPLIAARYGRY